MRINTTMARAMSIAAVIGLLAVPGLAQKYELHPYVGGMFNGEFGDDDDNFAREMNFKDVTVFGLRGGTHLFGGFGLEGNIGYMNHFEFENTDPELRALMWDVNGTFSLFPGWWQHFHPYATVGVGGLTTIVGEGTDVNNPDMVVFAIPTPVTPVPGSPIPRTMKPLVVEDGDTFFSINYGGGLKSLRLWGPVGLRASLLVRTLPNFYGETMHSLEGVGGLTFSWGER